MNKRRLDVLLVDRGLAESREKAQALVMAGQVTVDERPAPKPGVMVREDVLLDVARGPRYVSRGGDKLEHALHSFGLEVSSLTAADIGASTGGFTDCLLQHGVRKVYAIDVGRGQLDYRLRQDDRVISMEGVNAREMPPLPEKVDLAVIDVSFISLRLVLPEVVALLRKRTVGAQQLARDAVLQAESSGRASCCAPTTPARGCIVALFKPQFEATKEEVPRGGVIKDPQLHAQLIGRFAAWCAANGFRIRNLAASPILGAEGNREFLFLLRPSA